MTGTLLAARLSRDHDVLPLAHRDLDVTDPLAVARTVKGAKPDLVINCAVLGVDESERDRNRAAAVNADGAGNLARAAERSKAELLQFSTNWVFGGDARRLAYNTRDEAQPVNVYGVTKLTGECAALMHCSRSFVVRTSWIFGGPKPSFLTSVVERLRAGEKIRAINDVYGSVTYVHDLVDRVVEILGTKRYGVHHVANDGVCSYEEFAREAARIAKLDASLIEPITLREAKLVAPRPRYTPLACEPKLRPWQDALGAFVKTASS